MSALPNLGPRARKVVKIVGYIVLALVTFVFALQMTFPYNRVKDKLVEALASKYDVSIASVDRGFLPGRVIFNNVMLRTHVTKADEVPSTFMVKRLEVNLGILALIGGAASVSIDAEIGPGRISGTIALSKSGTEIDVDGVDLPSAMLPMKDLMGLPMSGKIGFHVDLDLPNEKSKTGKLAQNWQKAAGSIAFTCPSNCVFGDGKTKLKPKLKNSRQQAFAADGIDFGKVSVNSMAAHIKIDKGLLQLDKFDTKSEDGELHVDFQVTLAPQFDEGLVAGCLRFKGSEKLLEKEPRTHAALSTTGANMGPDGLFHIRLDGKFKEMKRLAQTCGGPSQNMDDPGNERARPSLSVQPSENKRDDKREEPTINPPAPVAPPADSGVAPNNQHDNGHNPGPENQGSAGSSANAGHGSGSGSANDQQQQNQQNPQNGPGGGPQNGPQGGQQVTPTGEPIQQDPPHAGDLEGSAQH